MNDMYLIKVSELPAINSRRQMEFDDILLEYIEKFKDITTNTNIIAHLIATAIDYPLDYVKEIIKTYKRSNLLTTDLTRISNKEYFVRETTIIKGQRTLFFIYDRKQNNLKEIDQTQTKQYDSKKSVKVELDNKDYVNIYTQLFYHDDFFDKLTKEKDKYLMSLTLKKVESDNYKEFFKDKIEIFELPTLTTEQVENLSKIDRNRYKRILGRYKQKNLFIDEIKNGKGYYEYNLANCKENDSFKCEKLISELLDMAEESIFIITTKLDPNSTDKTAAYLKLEEIKNKGNLYIRTLEGFNNDKKLNYLNKDIIITVNQEKDYYAQELKNMIHSKIIVIDNFLVALGSGNWFSNPRNEFEDSLIIFPCLNAIKEYCPIYYPTSDYYKIFEQLINQKKELQEMFDLYLVMQKDLSYNMNNNRNIYDEILIKKLETSIEENITKNFDKITNFLKNENINKDEIYNYLVSSNKIEPIYKEKLKQIYIDGEH